MHPTKGPYVEEYYDDYDEEEEDDHDKTGTATPDSLGLGPEHHRIHTPGRREVEPELAEVAAPSNGVATRKRSEPAAARGPPLSPQRPVKRATSAKLPSAADEARARNRATRIPVECANL